MSRVHVRRERTDTTQVAVLLSVVEAIADHELVRDIEPDITYVDAHLLRLGFPQQGTDLDRCGTPRTEVGDQPRQREPGVDDVFDDEYVAPADVVVEILEDAYDPGRHRARAVRRDRHPVHLDVTVDRPNEVGHDHHRALEHADEEQILALVVGRDALGELAEPGPDLVLAIQRLVEIEIVGDVLDVHAGSRHASRGVVRQPATARVEPDAWPSARETPATSTWARVNVVVRRHAGNRGHSALTDAHE